jgi:GxxExxY protein
MDISDFRSRNESRVSDEVEDLAYAVIGAAIEVRRELGPGLAEVHYKRAMSHELSLRAIPHAVEVDLDVAYKGKNIGKVRIDILVADQIVLELKAVEDLGPVHKAQALTYLRLANLTLALLINFNVAILKDGIKRVINT